MDQKAVFSTVSSDFEAVNSTIHRYLASDVPMVEKVAEYIIDSGGKRMRPLLVLLAGQLNGQLTDRHHLLAAIIEFLHTATLLHDDVVDKSDMRRGRATANANWGNAPSVLVGDFLYARSFEMLVELGNFDVMQSLSQATRVIAEGEVMQLMNVKNPDITEAQYMEVIKGKTAILFKASAETSGLISGYDRTSVNALADYGLNLGLAFQLIDDALDYAGDAEALGKNIGDDLAEGKPTLPLIFAMEKGTDEEKALVRNCIRKGGLVELDAVLEVIRHTDAIGYVTQKALTHADAAKQALASFADSDSKRALMALADLAVSRQS
ncbi:polyprenyl synthetase family protein [Reinekea blandensis]|uniref:Octaprenyl diphosphate synthase n=1 Tax=Reinekea blandensis MED297 TaxID=314283 RepID=A4BEE7_9GAMM|nr:polyprenyl synthetase family protein [Reinekea blandensis]EAR09625.1 Geranylgeranyl pyrophosphate synthase [Reinekea blandensis MED297]